MCNITYLVEGIAQRVGGVGGDDEGGVAGSGELGGEGGREGGLADAALAADHDVLAGGACCELLKGGDLGVYRRDIGHLIGAMVMRAFG